MAVTSYSWEGEDVLARKIFGDVFGIHRGFYVDVGAHHPTNHSNTHLLYLEGWRGINIDATPGSMAEFRTLRPEDVNLEVGVGATTGSATFYEFQDAHLNGFLSTDAIAEKRRENKSPVRSREIRFGPLTELLETHARDRAIDFMSVDIEGKDEEVLQTMDFARWRPKLLAVEILGKRLVRDVESSSTYGMLVSRGYELFSRLHFTSFFVDPASLPW